MSASTSDPCVCVQAAERKSDPTKSQQAKPQEGGVCLNSHTLFASLFASLLLMGAKLHTQTHTERPVCVQSVYTLSGGKDV